MSYFIGFSNGQNKVVNIVQQLVMKCKCGSEVFRVVGELEGLYFETKTLCVACNSVVSESTMDSDSLEHLDYFVEI